LPFKFEQLLFAFDAPAVATEFTVFANYAVAGDGYCYRVCGACPRYGSRGFGHSDLLRYGAVGAGFSSGDSLQRIPDSALESGGPDVEG
jgi:hypothetical protein